MIVLELEVEFRPDVNEVEAEKLLGLPPYKLREYAQKQLAGLAGDETWFSVQGAHAQRSKGDRTQAV
jgi:hypothetical protein